MEGFSDEDLGLSTGNSNTIGWIFGHLIYYRGKILQELNQPCEMKEFEMQFARGAVKNKNIKLNFNETMELLIKRGEEINTAIDSSNEKVFNRELDMEMNGAKLTVESYLSMLAWHETFHIGQIDLIKVACGKEGIK